MDEILKQLLEAEILTEDTKNELETAIKTQLEESVKQARKDAHAEVTAALNEQWIEERETLIDALDTKITEALTEELLELKESIETFRDLEAEYAQRLIEAKEEMSQTVKTDIATLVEQLDTFVELRLVAELEELKEDLAIVRKNEFGKNIYEAFAAEFKKYSATDENSIEAKLTEAEQRLEDTLIALEKSEKRTAQMVRASKLAEVLAPLSGRQREVMEAILKSVETPMLEEAFQTYVGRVLKETTEVSKPSEKEVKVLAEGATKTEIVGVAKSGDNEDQLIVENHMKKIDESNSVSTMSPEAKKRYRALAGIDD